MTDPAIQTKLTEILQLLKRQQSTPSAQPSSAHTDDVDAFQVLDNSDATTTGRGRAVEYVKATESSFDDLAAAEDFLNDIAGLSDGKRMSKCNDYGSKRTATSQLRYRCPFARKKGFAVCKFVGMISCDLAGKHTVYVSAGPHIPHQPLPGFEEYHAENTRKEKLRSIVDDCVKKGAKVDATLRAVIDEGIAASDGITKELETFVYNRRAKVIKTLNLGVPKPGDSMLELIEFCEANSAIPSDPDSVFCLCHRMGDDDSRDFMAIFSTRRLLETNGRLSTVCLDYTFKLSWCSMPVVAYGGLLAPSRFCMLALGYSISESASSVKFLMESVRDTCRALSIQHCPDTMVGDAAGGYDVAWEDVRRLLRLEPPTAMDADFVL
ncbi:hypothetical protein FOZ63_027525 [Perkinsus olseni]|uniref:MULE transposase domain-containing protein n=1 Tax=Perkinsus olseni TaxID=32597 RepID=A0A7J6RI06_PEROL|nr:hypothetical protein FOZ62_031408 [Perkinsus olseni]KAF4720439.1 hypothetical protein FOZ63_027525 [Perkinsus olseni]